MFKNLVREGDAVNAQDIAQEALQSTKASHHRLDKINKIIFWVGTTVIGAIIVRAITIAFKFKGA